jgi:mRNA-degrading endonuclease toxin of MazEF toxin-antitoxin module
MEGWDLSKAIFGEGSDGTWIKITTVPKSRIGSRVGRLADEDIVRLNRAALVFLGIAAPRDRE